MSEMLNRFVAGLRGKLPGRSDEEIAWIVQDVLKSAPEASGTPETSTTSTVQAPPVSPSSFESLKNKSLGDMTRGLALRVGIPRDMVDRVVGLPQNPPKTEDQLLREAGLIPRIPTVNTPGFVPSPNFSDMVQSANPALPGNVAP